MNMKKRILFTGLLLLLTLGAFATTQEKNGRNGNCLS